MLKMLHEIKQFSFNDLIWLIFVSIIFFIGIVILILSFFRGLKQIKISFGKDGIKINDTTNSKLDEILNKLTKLEKDVVALQIMNEQLTPPERLKLYDYYKNELHGNSFIDEYIETIIEQIDKTGCVAGRIEIHNIILAEKLI